MTREDISNKILKKIKNENLKPKPKWEFLLKNYIFWGAFIISIVIGRLVASVAIFRIINNDWDIAGRLGHNPVTFGFKTMPFFWLIILAIFIFIAYYNFKHTKKGYKFQLPLTIAASIIASIVLGFAFFGAGIAKQMDEQALRRIPFYQSLNFDNRMEMWAQTDKGVLAGEITKITRGSIEIESLEGGRWTVNTIAVPEHLLASLEEGMVVGVIGEKEEKGVFSAEKIRPWKGNFMRRGQINHRPMKEMKLFLRTT